jgi:enoyl-CoA hydratase/carnithine racemase
MTMSSSSILPNPSSTKPSKFGRGTVSVLRREKVLIAAVDRPEVRNAFNDDVYSDLTDVMHQVAADSSLVALILTGRGSFFSSGADLKTTPLDPKKHVKSILKRPAGRFVMSLLAFPKIVVAAGTLSCRVGMLLPSAFLRFLIRALSKN